MDTNRINLEVLKFEDLGFLGAGSFAQVRKAKFNNQLVAVKILTPTNDAKAEADFFKEVLYKLIIYSLYIYIYIYFVL